MMENPIKMDDLGVTLFLETPISNLHDGCHPHDFVAISHQKFEPMYQPHPQTVAMTIVATLP